MIRAMSYTWQLRLKMAEKGLFHTSDLVPLLAERGIHLSREQVFRLVTHTPQRLSLDTLAALCDILQVTPNDLIEVTAQPAQVAKTGTRDTAARRAKPAARRTTIRRPDGA
jgi:DNA-binding Xre family transcriptional regulator